MGLYIGKPKKPLYVNNSPNQNSKPLNFAHWRNFAPKITYANYILIRINKTLCCTKMML